LFDCEPSYFLHYFIFGSLPHVAYAAQQKYTKWADKAKGINPFVPSKPRVPRSLAGKIGMTALYAPVVLPRLLLFSVFATVAVVARVIISPVGVVAAAAITKVSAIIAGSVVLGTLMVQQCCPVLFAS
jgi:hypothetical protein